jgi:molybdopterin converting factor small subunit
MLLNESTDLTRKKEESVDAVSVADLKAKLFAVYPLLNTVPFLVSCGNKIVNDNQALNDGDQIGLLPPFAGG